MNVTTKLSAGDMGYFIVNTTIHKAKVKEVRVYQHLKTGGQTKMYVYYLFERHGEQAYEESSVGSSVDDLFEVLRKTVKE